VAYDGRPFAGWQSQTGGNTVQDRLLGAIRAICPQVRTVQGAGRTDAGVGALAQVAHFDAPVTASLDAGAWLRAVNAKLPPAIRVMACEQASPGFHARFSATSKTYRYEIFTGPVLPPLKAGLAWQVRKLGNREVFRAAIELFEGVHDFRAFSANRGDGHDEDRDTVRTIFETKVEECGESMTVEFTGNGFLYKMVRFLVGTSVRAAQGRLTFSDITVFLQKTDDQQTKAPYCAPADGLTLVKVLYQA
jgi:tRNA pseudouridine38-40 synthase